MDRSSARTNVEIKPKIISKIDPKSPPRSSKNPKQIQNHRQNGPKSRSGGGLGGSWSLSGRLGRVLGRISCVLWRLGCILERLGGFLGASWGVSGRISVGKVANMAPTWLPKWSQDGDKIRSKTRSFFDASWSRFLDDCLPMFGPKMEPTWHQNGIQNRC